MFIKHGVKDFLSMAKDILTGFLEAMISNKEYNDQTSSIPPIAKLNLASVNKGGRLQYMLNTY